jgi:membrane protease YdiL (CAAX protease family)
MAPSALAHLKTRSLLAWWILTGLLLSLVPECDLLHNVVLYGALAGWLAWQLSRHAVPLPAVLGRWPSASQGWRHLGVVVPLALFSLGAFCVLYAPLSLLAPSLVVWLLNAGLVHLPEGSAPARVAQFALVAGVGPAIEELLFRGVLLHRWAAKWGLPRAMLATSLAFGLLHVNIVGMTAFGYVMAVLYLKTRTLLLPIACHMLTNALAVGLLLLGAGQTAPVAAATLEELRAECWWTAGPCVLVSVPWLVTYLRANSPGKVWTVPRICQVSTQKFIWLLSVGRLASLSPLYLVANRQCGASFDRSPSACWAP